MKKYEVIPCKSIDGIQFGADREQVRAKFGKKFKEMKKSIFSKNTIDAYDEYHIYYNKDNKLEAIEIFGKINVEIDGKQIYPGTVEGARKIIADLSLDELTSVKASVGLTTDQDDENKIEAILVGCAGYYK